MNIPKIIDAITKFFLKLDLSRYFGGYKLLVLIAALFLMLLYILGALTSILPGF